MIGKQFAVIHAQKGPASGGSRLGAHIDRKFIPENANPDLVHLNEHYIKSDNTMNRDIKDRIEKVGCKVRSNSVKSVNIILSGSHERMKEIEKDPELLKNWVKDNAQFVKNRYGVDNVMRFSLHRDERTPHIHCVITPITKDGRLSAREIVGNKKDLQQLQDDYAEAMKKYSLHRGLKGSKAKHYEVSEYYARIKDPVEAKISIPVKENTESNPEYTERVKSALKPLIFNFEQLKKENKAIEKDFQSTYERAIDVVNGMLEGAKVDVSFKVDWDKQKVLYQIPSVEKEKQKEREARMIKEKPKPKQEQTKDRDRNRGPKLSLG